MKWLEVGVIYPPLNVFSQTKINFNNVALAICNATFCIVVMESKLIGIITNSKDLHTDYVIEKLQQRAIKYVRINSEELLQTFKTIKFTEQDLSVTNIHSIGNNGKLDFKNITSFWYRRPLSSNLQVEIDKNLSDFTRTESTVFIEGLWLLCKDAFWLNDPFAMIKARNKVYQLHLAQAIGLRIPRTIITSSPRDAKNFYHECQGKVITKVLSRPLIEVNGKLVRIRTNLLLDQDFQSLESVKNCPTLLQEFINKKSELRVTIVGTKVFICEILSQINERTVVDYKNDIKALPHLPSTLSEEVEIKCKQLMISLGLNFCTIDLVLKNDGQYIFLEINPNGQWLWIEERTGLPISEAIINLLYHQESPEY